MRFRGPVVCARRRWATIAAREAARHVPGLCGQWFGSRPASQMAGVSLSLSFSVYLVQLCPRAPPPPPPPRADEEISSCKQRRAKNQSLCAPGMHKTAENMPLKRCWKTSAAPVLHHSAFYYFLGMACKSPEPMRNMLWKGFLLGEARSFSPDSKDP